MPKCVYCGKLYDIPRGLTLVMNDGRIQYLCSSKCRKNMLMKRRKVRWVKKSDQNKIDMAERKEKKE
jgi:large subunit ribosomal protein L24e